MFLKFGEIYLLGDLQSSGKPKQDKNKVTCKHTMVKLLKSKAKKSLETEKMTCYFQRNSDSKVRLVIRKDQQL